MKTPFDHLQKMWERVVFPTAQYAYRKGFEDGKDAATPPPVPVEVVHRPGVDAGFYIVQEETAFSALVMADASGCWHAGPETGRRWTNVAAFPATHAKEANAKADERFVENSGRTRVEATTNITRTHHGTRTGLYCGDCSHRWDEPDPTPACVRCAEWVGGPPHEPSRRCHYRPAYVAHCSCRACWG